MPWNDVVVLQNKDRFWKTIESVAFQITIFDAQNEDLFTHFLSSSFKSHFWNEQQASLLPGFQRNFAALFVLNYWFRQFPLSAIVNVFDFSCPGKQLMLLSYKICPFCAPRDDTVILSKG